MAIDIESCTELNPNLENESSKKVLNGLTTQEEKILDESCGYMSHGDKIANENMHSLIDINLKIDAAVAVLVTRDLVEKEKRKLLSAKKPPKPPKPPRPPRDSPLDAADKKLVREIAEIAMIKRSKVERMKALKKTRATKASSSSTSSSSGGSYLAMLLTFVFCLVLLCNGFSSKIKSPTRLGDTLVKPTLDLDAHNFTKGTTS